MLWTAQVQARVAGETGSFLDGWRLLANPLWITYYAVQILLTLFEVGEYVPDVSEQPALRPWATPRRGR